jgi:hypothetical protein
VGASDKQSSSALAAAEKKSWRRISAWVALGVFVFAFNLGATTLGGGGDASVSAVIPLVAVMLLVYAGTGPLLRRSQRRNEDVARATGALWGGVVAAQPPNLGLGEAKRTLLSVWTTRYWRSFARGSLRVLPGGIVFEPGRPGPKRPTVRIQPDDVASIGSGPHGPGGILEVQLRDGNSRQFLLFGPPGVLNDRLRDAGFPVG